MRKEGYQIRRPAFRPSVANVDFWAAGNGRRLSYWGLGGAGEAGAAVPGAVLAAFFGAGFFLTTGFLGGSLSSTTSFFGGAAGIAACAVFRSARKRIISCSFDAARLFVRSANCFRVPSKPLRSLDSA
jgi:hypothetical protein